MIDTAGYRAGGGAPAAARAGAGDASPVVRAAWPLAVATAVFALALGTPLVIVAATGDHLEHPAAAAILRASWIGLYALVGVYFARRRSHRRLGLTMTAAAALTAIASTDVLAGQVAYTVSHTVAIALVPVLVLMLISIPEARAVRDRAAAVLVASIPIGLALGTAYLMVAAEAPWGQAGSACAGTCAGSAIQVADAPVLAHGFAIGVVVAIIVPFVVVGLAFARVLRTASPITVHALTWIAGFMAVWIVPLLVGLVAVAIDPVPGRLGPYQVTVSAIRAALPLAMLAIVLGRAARTDAIRHELTARLARAGDPVHVQQVISDVLGDPSLRLAFRDGTEWIDVEGRPIGVDAAPDRGWVAMDDDRTAAMVFDPALQAQEGRMLVIAGLGAAALDRARTEAELRAMRRRLVSIADDERQRIERNLHDGAQQRLIAMTVRVEMARQTLASHPEMAQAILKDVGSDVQQALDELRELAHGLHPPVLVDHGLADALRAAARHSPVPVDLAITDVGRLDPLMEAAVYFCCSEALQNAVKHGGAGSRIAMGLWRDRDGALVFEVIDDGPGFVVEPLRPGTGLMGMKDRVAAVDGELTIDSAPGRGTRVRGRIPLEPAAGTHLLAG